jgi:hypothetical protein
VAVILKREIVCDFGGEKCDNTDLHRVRVTIDGRSKAKLVCEKHKRPLEPFMDGATPTRPRAKVYTIDAIRSASQPGGSGATKSPRPRKSKTG